LKLIIEVDGRIHSLPDVQIRDIERQKHLELDGISFLRFTNNEVEKGIEGVMERIKGYLKERG
jgi:very-short-patch-repair endonuclease